MKITKALRPACITSVQVNRQGFEHDRRFMLVKVEPDGKLKNIQTIYFPECTRLFQEIDGDEVVVTYRTPAQLLIPKAPEQSTALRVPLQPETAGLETMEITLMGSTGTAYRMGDEYNTWFSACLGYEAILIYLGDGKRPVLAHAPTSTPPPQQKGWLSSLASYVVGGQARAEPDGNWLSFNEAAPLLVTSEASLSDVSARLPDGQSMDMKRFRPNIVVDGVEKWDEDFWAELSIGGGSSSSSGGANVDEKEADKQPLRLALTANCARCLSINIDYDTGRVAEGEAGTMLKKLMKDRRVDTGNKWSPIFGRYAFLREQQGTANVAIAVGDGVTVTRRNSERDVWVWPKEK